MGVAMTQDEIIRMAREAGFQASDLDTMFWQVMERFAALVAAHEREKQAEQEPEYDLSNVIHLTHNKAKHIIKSRGYSVTGFVLTREDGGKCIVDMSAVRWFDDKLVFQRMMHSDTPKEWLSPPVEHVKQEPVAWQEVVSNVANNLGEMAAQAHTQRFCDGINAEVDKLFALVATPVEHVGEINQFGVFVSTLNFRALPIGTKFYTAPIRTKDLTDDEIADIVYEMNGNEPTAPFWRDLARAVITADREKNK